MKTFLHLALVLALTIVGIKSECLVDDLECTSTEGALEALEAQDPHDCMQQCKNSPSASQINYAYMPAYHLGIVMCYCLAECQPKRKYFALVADLTDSTTSEVCKLSYGYEP
ncbi:hypothetical protein TCAL_05011 [Tigriopus californicus]|uniref:Secreted protein n=1 Tax=Tigriopus californicus TaxID=6832 RepID=A0A553PKV2_TIGCA|nr:hypothetical protein TCAL_05011 [Tigriopus californicus]|eukprot:TCALIF_05011-PA protein Name:"Protein of unknown function" AED:0.00 eAED:0.00 QI:7/1/1/1/0/0.5/2/73/111